MELLFVIVIAAGLGFLARYTIRGREMHGGLLLASVAAAVAAVVWVALLWLGFTFDGGWIWAISLTVAGLAAIIVAVRLPQRRHANDRALLTKLSGGRA